ncbi:MAG: hypothetical protein LBV75_04185 [Paludibacter sp.]|jgi:hypothetical protein|nr:hypothetical protein [Paludibacter sp.]
MNKEKTIIEYHLNKASISHLWNSIGTTHGLAEWFADDVTVENNIYTFRWSDHEQKAILKKQKLLVYMRFQWLEDKDSDYIFEIRLQTAELTGEVILLITDYAYPNEIDDLKMLWNQQIDALCRKIGI